VTKNYSITATMNAVNSGQLFAYSKNYFDAAARNAWVGNLVCVLWRIGATQSDG